MDEGTKWRREMEKHVERAEVNFSERDYSKYRVEQFKRTAAFLDRFAGSCTTCNMYRHSYAQQAQNLGGLVLQPEEERNAYLKQLNQYIRHLKRKHKVRGKREIIWGTFAVAVGIAFASSGNLRGIFDEPMRLALVLVIAIPVILLAVKIQVDKAKKEGKLL